MRLALALLLLLAAAPARAAEPNPRALDEARTRFQAGVQLFHEGSFDAALAEFRKAYSLAPSYRVLYNIAQVQFELHDHVEALKTFRQYLQEGGADIPPDRRAQVEGEVQKLERRVSLVEIVVDVDGAQILLDDVPVGTSPLRLPVMVNAGNRRITATKPGRVTTARALTVAGGDRVTVELKLPEVAVARPIEGLVPVAPLPQAERPRTKMWLGALTETSRVASKGGAVLPWRPAAAIGPFRSVFAFRPARISGGVLMRRIPGGGCTVAGRRSGTETSIETTSLVPKLPPRPVLPPMPPVPMVVPCPPVELACPEPQAAGSHVTAASATTSQSPRVHHALVIISSDKRS